MWAKVRTTRGEESNRRGKAIIEEVDQEWFILSDHSMTKDHYISFITFATGDQVKMMKQYPEWSLQSRIPKCGNGKLFWYDTQLGLYDQLV